MSEYKTIHFARLKRGRLQKQGEVGDIFLVHEMNVPHTLYQTHHDEFDFLEENLSPCKNDLCDKRRAGLQDHDKMARDLMDLTLHHKGFIMLNAYPVTGNAIAHSPHCRRRLSGPEDIASFTLIDIVYEDTHRHQHSHTMRLPSAVYDRLKKDENYPHRHSAEECHYLRMHGAQAHNPNDSTPASSVYDADQDFLNLSFRKNGRLCNPDLHDRYALELWQNNKRTAYYDQPSNGLGQWHGNTHFGINNSIPSDVRPNENAGLQNRKGCIFGFIARWLQPK